MRPPRQKSKADRSPGESADTTTRAAEPKCPHCHAQDAEVISLFGTQAMTLQYRCRRCGDYFEAIKY